MNRQERRHPSRTKIESMTITHMSVMVLWTLHNDFDFNKDQINKFYAAMGKLGECMASGLVNVRDMQDSLERECEVSFR